MTKQSRVQVISNINLQKTLSQICDSTDQSILAKCSVDQALHTLDLLDIDYRKNSLITSAIDKSLLWQDKQATSAQIKCASLSLQKLASETVDCVEKNAYKALSHAVASADLKEHAILSFDYGVKALGLHSDNNMDIINKVRQEQIETLKEKIKTVFSINHKNQS